MCAFEHGARRLQNFFRFIAFGARNLELHGALDQRHGSSASAGAATSAAQRGIAAFGHARGHCEIGARACCGGGGHIGAAIGRRRAHLLFDFELFELESCDLCLQFLHRRWSNARRSANRLGHHGLNVVGRVAGGRKPRLERFKHDLFLLDLGLESLDAFHAHIVLGLALNFEHLLFEFVVRPQQNAHLFGVEARGDIRGRRRRRRVVERVGAAERR